MSTANNEHDPSFATLPIRLRHRIDNAFDSVASPLRQSGSEVSAGGFIIGESSESAVHEAGGFLVEDFPSTSAKSHILLSEVPRALNLLDLPPDDDLMGVFRNAAAGWGAQNTCNNGVSRKDWRAICAALMEGQDAAGSNEENDVDVDADSSPDSDEYQMEEPSEEDSSDEYEESLASRVVARTKAQNVSQTTPLMKNSTGQRLTPSQKAQCRQDFARFFPHVPDDQLDQQRIMIKDITRVADLLKENLKADEILDMLEVFSTSPDKSVNLADFEHMMVLTKLI